MKFPLIKLFGNFWKDVLQGSLILVLDFLLMSNLLHNQLISSISSWLIYLMLIPI